MKKSRFLLPCAAILLYGATLPVRADEQAPPVAAVPLQEGVRWPMFESAVLRPGEVAPLFALPDGNNKLIASRRFIGDRALLVISLGAPAPLDVDDLTLVPDIAQQAARGPLTPEQVLAARRVAEAVKAAAPRLKKQNVAVVIIAGGSYFAAIKEAMGPDFKPAALPEAEELDPTPDAPNLFILRDDVPLSSPNPAAAVPGPAVAGLIADRRIAWSGLAGRSESGVSLCAIDRAGFIRASEAVTDLLNLESLLVLSGDVTPILEVGKPAPDFSMRDANGRVRRLSDLRGQKNLLLSFFPKCFTGG